MDSCQYYHKKMSSGYLARTELPKISRILWLVTFPSGRSVVILTSYIRQGFASHAT